MRIRRGIKYLLIPRRSDPGKAYIQVSVTWDGNRVRKCLGLDINVRGWNHEKGRCLPRTSHGDARIPAMTVNSYLEELEEKVECVFRSCETEERLPSRSEIAECMDYRQDDPTGEVRMNTLDQRVIPVLDVYRAQQQESGQWRPSTVKKYERVDKLLRSISEDLTFRDLDSKESLERILKKCNKLSGKRGAVGFSNSTTAKNIAFIKTFLRWCEEKGYTPHVSLVSQKPRLKRPQRPIVFLNWEELMRLYGMDYSLHPAKERVRDVFCFCCFTSLRFSDVFNLRRTDISDGYIELTTVKTSEKLRIDLNKYSKAILDKYVDSRSETVFPPISNQKFNDWLKVIGKECGLDEPVRFTVYRGARREDTTSPKYEVLSSHAARRTFVCNALAMGIPPDIVMKWTGHSSYAAMKPYIDISSDAKRKAMEIFDAK